MNCDGSIISSILPPAPIKTDLLAAQFQAANDPKKKFTIAHALVKAKITRSLQVLDWLGQRYDIQREIRVAKREAAKLDQAHTVSQLRTVEGRVALRYWEAVRKVLPEWLDFQGRMTSTHQNNASDPFNAALNYGYRYLKSECQMAINAVGLEPAVGFLHETSSAQTSESMCYDLMEPFRFLADLCVIEAFERGILDKADFYFTFADLRYRFNEDPKLRFVNLIRQRFSSGVRYKGRNLQWDTVIQEKANELARFLVGKSSKLNFVEPFPTLERSDNKELRQRIKALNSEDAKNLGIDKSMLYTLRQHVRKEKPFKLQRKTLEKLQSAINS